MKISNNKNSQYISIRLKGYDYRLSGAYFVTICCNFKNNILGKISKQSIILNSLGKIAYQCWEEIPKHFPEVLLDEFIIMPNHLHGIIILTENTVTESVCKKPPKLGTIIGTFKSASTKLIKIQQQEIGLSVWQRNYFERIIRNDFELDRIRKYIYENPIHWDEDEYNTTSMISSHPNPWDMSENN